MPNLGQLAAVIRKKTDFVIIGSGIAGLYTALKLSAHGDVVVLCKKSALDSNTWYAQGGIAAAFDEQDTPEKHFADTLLSGAGFGDQKAIRLMVEEGPSCIRDLLDLGVEFDRRGSQLDLGQEGAHSCRRILRIGGDATGRFLVGALHRLATQNERITIIEDAFALELLTDEGRCLGVRWTDSEIICEHLAQAVVLATGGGGYLYYHTTNPVTATADGLALAYQAGASLSDLEFVQFHPTVFFHKDKAFLISEAVRGEGAYLLNEQGKRFMTDYHPQGELGPRDVLARAIIKEKEISGGNIWLDLRRLGKEFISKRFPTIYSTCLDWGLDIAAEPVPICPAAHYFVGGVLVDTGGETDLKGLYAVGEAAATGVHGANRLASNSLLEALVFGRKAAWHIAGFAQFAGDLRSYTYGEPLKQSSLLPEDRLLPKNPSLDACRKPPAKQFFPQTPLKDRIAVAAAKEKLRKLMWHKVSLFRTEEMLQDAFGELQGMLNEWMFETISPDIKEVQNMLQAGCFIAAAALERRESRGCHYRLDYPETDSNEKYKLVFHKESGLKGVRQLCISHPG